MLGSDPNTPRRTICLAGSPFSSKVATSKLEGFPTLHGKVITGNSLSASIGLVFTRGVREYCSYPTPVVPSGCKSGDMGVYDRTRTCVGQTHNLLPNLSATYTVLLIQANFSFGNCSPSCFKGFPKHRVLLHSTC